MKRKISLGTIADVRREIANVYRDAKDKTLDIGEAHKLTMILRELVKAVDVENKTGGGGEVETNLNNIADAIRQRDIEKPTS